MSQNKLNKLTSVAALVMAVFAAATPLRAEDKKHTLPEIMAMAREHNGELKALRQELGISEAGKTRAGLRPNPILELEGATGALTGSSSENRAAIGVSQEFLLGGKRDKRLAVAETELTRLSNRLKDAERMVLLEVKTGFYDLLLTENRFDLAQKSLELNNQLLLITKERLAAGDVAELDVNLAKVEVARSDARKIESERELEPARQRLLALMGAPSLTTLNIAVSPAARPLLPNAAELRALALQYRPDLQAALAEKRKGAAAIYLAHSERIPNLTAGISFSREGTETSLGGLSERSTDYLIGLKFSIPIPVFDKNEAGIQEAQARKNSAESRHQYLTQNIEREVDAAQARVASAEKSLTIYSKEIIPQLTENLKLVQEAYRLGEVGIQAVIEEQKKFIEVNDAQLAALHSWNGAVAKLEAAVGTELKKEDGGNN